MSFFTWDYLPVFELRISYHDCTVLEGSPMPVSLLSGSQQQSDKSARLWDLPPSARAWDSRRAPAPVLSAPAAPHGSSLVGPPGHGSRVSRQLKPLAGIRHLRAVHPQDGYVAVQEVADVEVLSVRAKDSPFGKPSHHDLAD